MLVTQTNHALCSSMLNNYLLALILSLALYCATFLCQNFNIFQLISKIFSDKLNLVRPDIRCFFQLIVKCNVLRLLFRFSLPDKGNKATWATKGIHTPKAFRRSTDTSRFPFPFKFTTLNYISNVFCQHTQYQW